MMRQLFDMPAEMARLPRDHRGYPVPEFVAWIDGVPDFRVVKPGWIKECHDNHRCWLCGGGMGRRKFFVVGPMCCVNRVSSEPPSHRGCAEFAAKNCPFLTKPLAVRNERDMPENRKDPAGQMITRNPGVCAIWETKHYEPFKVGSGVLFDIGKPGAVTFWREGRKATRTEVEESVQSGMSFLKDAAEAEGRKAVDALVREVMTFSRLLNTIYPTGEARGQDHDARALGVA
jgi:hypothetical protein